ncbi:MAG: FAD-binding and (Fe-S)-binding domain-containing protein [Phycisphaeraceae bacterium]
MTTAGQDAIALTGAAAALRDRLAAQLEGEVRFDAGSRAMYAQDASHYRQVPIGVVAPQSVQDIETAVRICREHDAALLVRGAGTSLAGQGCNVAVVLDCTKHLNRILEIDPKHRLARVEPGVVLDDLRAAAQRHGLTFGPDPSTHAVCTIGGMIGNNACGVHSQTAGRTSENVESMEVLTCDGTRLRVGATSDDALAQRKAKGGREGEIYTALAALREEYADFIRARYPDMPRRVSGYNLDELLPERGFHVARALVGSEGTCAIVLEATVRLVPCPPARAMVVLAYPDVAAAGDDVTRVLEYAPIGLEGTADSLIANMRARQLEAEGLALLPEGGGWLFAEFGGETREQAVERAQRLMRDLETPRMVLIDEPAQMRALWSAREAAVGASARFADGTDTWPGWEDAAVPPSRLGQYLREFQALLDQHGYRATIYGHFGQGCVHARIDFDMTTAAGVERYRRFVEAAADLVVRHGGSLSGEHGDGQSRAELLHRMFGPDLVAAFSRFKTIWDPQHRMSPGKLVQPHALTDDLRLGAHYELPQLETHFQYPDDDESFARATNRCIGVGKCLRHHGGTMCPSYMVTREERHTTRGRARLLQEMAHGRLVNGWRNEEVKAALDLCLACKGCKGECPAGVDVATYKAEFLAHYYRGRLRPRAAYAFGLVHRWARLASLAPRAVNRVLRLPLVGGMAKRLAGMAPSRQVPRFAPLTFRRWFAHRAAPAAVAEAPRVLLWPDTFNNHFQPDVLRSTVVVLEDAGFRVVLPERALCCGRPLYDFGMLDRAEAHLWDVLDALGPMIEEDVPVVGLEPSCVAVFRDELVNLLPDSVDARRLRAGTYTLAEFLRQRAPDYRPPHLTGRAIFHGHCHQKALMGTSDDVALLRATGLEVQTPDTGCCGMAGSFGFQREHHELSLQIGERVLLPLVREADENTWIITDGFSCREQIAQGTGRRVWHLAEVLAQRSGVTS